MPLMVPDCLHHQVIHSDLGTPHLFGATDLGRSGIGAFLRSHKCNDVCRLLHLPENKDFVEENVGQLENSSVNTSFISVAQTKHLAMRAAERKINQREMQARCHLPTDARCHLPTDARCHLPTDARCRPPRSTARSTADSTATFSTSSRTSSS